MNRTGRTARKQDAPALGDSCGASLSVVLVSTGSPDARAQAAYALSSVMDAAQVIMVVRGDADPAISAHLTGLGVEYVSAPAGCTRAEMCDIGMSRATGAIVAMRDDLHVGNASWLAAFHGVVPGLAAAQSASTSAPAPSRETVVMDTMVLGTGTAGDGRQNRTSVARSAREVAVPPQAASVEMAAIA